MCRIGDAPSGAIEQERGKIGGEDFRTREGFESPGAGFFPQAVADSRLGASRATAPLVGRRSGDANRLEPGETNIRLVYGNAGKA